MHFRRSILTAAIVAAVSTGLAAPALRAQEAQQPVALISLSPLERLLGDTSYLLRACNVPEMGGFVTIMANQYTQGLDRSRPIGATVTLEGQNPSVVLFMPITDIQQFFGALAGMGIEPDDLGDGLFEIDANGQTIFVKESGDWMFIAQSEQALAAVPSNPAGMLGSLPERYTLAVRLNVQALPDELKGMITEQMRIGFERGLAEQADQTEEEKAAAREMGEASIAQIEQMVSDTEQVIFGWAVDSDAQKTYIDSGARFVAGSKLAEQVETAKGQTSDYTAFILPGAAAKFRFSSTISDADKPVAKNNIKNSLSQLEDQLAQNDELPEEAKQLITHLVEGLAAIGEKTIDEGVFDGAGSVSVADDTLRILIGGRIADGNALAAEVKEAAEAIPSDQGLTFEFDYANHQGIDLHKITIPVKIADPGAKKVFGDALNIVVGTGEKSFMFALDSTGDAAVKAAIDAMNGSKGVEVSPFESVVQLGQILRFAQTISPNSMLDNAIDTISQYAGNDKVEVNGNLIQRGMVYRLSIDEGVLRSIGVAAKSGAGGGGGF